jgi:hypothetical protein
MGEVGWMLGVGKFWIFVQDSAVASEVDRGRENHGRENY